VDIVPALTSASPRVTSEEAEALAAKHYDILATARRLPGEKDDNFALECEQGTFLLKVAHPDEPADDTALHTSLLAHLAEVPDIPVQQLIPAQDGRTEVRVADGHGRFRIARITSYLPGRMLRVVPSTPALRDNLGRTLARLGQELRGFQHPRSRRPVLWDLWRADLVRPLLDDLKALAGYDLLVQCLDRFESHVRPRVASLRRQMVHNDFSADNVLIGDDDVSVVGIIDFGDAVETQLINDIAVAATNQLNDDGDPMAPAVDLVGAYHGVIPLTVPELEVLYDLVRLRLTMRIIITEWRSMRFPENREYVMRNTPRAWAHLESLPASGAPDVSRRFITACGGG
jgi:hydroxylysine kinase